MKGSSSYSLVSLLFFWRLVNTKYNADAFLPVMTTSSSLFIHQDSRSSSSRKSYHRSKPKFKIGSIFAESQSSSIMEERNLRFSCVGRLYANPSLKSKNRQGGAKKNDNSNIQIISTNEPAPHLQVVERLSRATVIVVGLGGVGSWAAEAICRSGVGHLVLIDLDDICISNTNRQLHALSSAVGKMKIDEMAKRFKDINPHCNITLIHDFVSPENVDQIVLETIGLQHLSDNKIATVCLDAIDGAIGKASLIAACSRFGIPIVTCGGSAGRTDPTKFLCDDLTRASGDRLLSTCRKTLRKAYGFEEGKSFRESHGNMGRPVRKWNIPAVFSTEPQKELPQGDKASSLRRCDGALGTASFVTGTCGFVAAGKIIDMIANESLVVPRRFTANRPRPS